MRTLVDIPERQLNDLNAISAARKLSRAEVIRQAVDAFIAQNRPGCGEAFGLWQDAGNKSPVDGLAYQERLRSEW